MRELQAHTRGASREALWEALTNQKPGRVSILLTDWHEMEREGELQVPLPVFTHHYYYNIIKGMWFL